MTAQLKHLKMQNNTTTKTMENKQTAMQQLLNQMREERNKLPILIEWDRAYQAIEMMIENTYIPLEKEQMIKAYTHAYLIGEDNININDANNASEQYYNETFKQD